MKKKIIAMISATLVITTLLCSCDTKENNKETKQQVSTNNVINTSSPSPTEKTESPTISPDPTTEPTPKPKNIKGSKLFEDVYVPFASREEGCAFEVVKSFVEATSFKHNINKPSKKDNGSIKVFSKNGDYVYFIFYSANDLDVIMNVGYYQKKTKREVSLSNYSTDNSYEYDTLSTQISGKEAKEVSSIKKQREFLFKK